jgi:AcrR family transcriptional regulator
LSKRENRESKKEHILAAALDRFSRYGYASTTLDMIARDCRITKPAIYYHFKDKAALYEAIVCSQFTVVTERIEAATQSGDARERLHNYIAAFGEYLIGNPSFSAIFSREIAGGAATLPPRCTVILSRTLLRLIAILDAGKAEGIFKEENPFMLQMMIVSTLTSYNTTKGLRERIVAEFSPENQRLEPHFENVIDDLSSKIIKALTC